MKNLILFDIDKEDKENWITYQNKDKTFQIEVKKFLTLEQINEIVNLMLATDSIGRLLIKTTMLTELCTNIDIKQFLGEDEKINTSELYDSLAENGLLYFDSEISNANEIDRLIKQEESTYRVALNLTKSIEESLNKVNTKELLGAVTQLQGMANENGQVIDFNNAKNKKK